MSGLEDMNINDLRKEAKRLGVSASGNKADILARIKDVMKSPEHNIAMQLKASRDEISSYSGDRVIGIDAGAYQTKVLDSHGNEVVVRNLVADLLPGSGIRDKVVREGGQVFERGERNVVVGDDVVKFLRYVNQGSIRSPVKKPGELSADLPVYAEIIPFALAQLGRDSDPITRNERLYISVLVPGEAEPEYRLGLKNFLLRLSYIDGKRVKVDGVRSLPEAFAEGLAILNPSDYLHENAVLNTGHRTTDVAVMLGDQPLPGNLRTIHLGGWNVTERFEEFLRDALDDAGYTDVRLTPEQIHTLKERSLHLYGAERPNWQSVTPQSVEVPVGYNRTDILRMAEGVDAPFRELVEGIAPRIAGLLKNHPVETVYLAGGNVPEGAGELLAYTLANLPGRDKVEIDNVYRVEDKMAGTVGAVLHDIRHGYKGRQRTVKE